MKPILCIPLAFLLAALTACGKSAPEAPTAPLPAPVAAPSTAAPALVSAVTTATPLPVIVPTSALLADQTLDPNVDDDDGEDQDEADGTAAVAATAAYSPDEIRRYCGGRARQRAEFL